MASAMALAGAAGCAGPRFPGPMTAGDAADLDSGDALVAYLAQRDASAAVCDARSVGPHLARLDEDGREPFVDGLVDGRVPPDLWKSCAERILASESREDGAALFDSIGHAYRKTLTDSDLEKYPGPRARLEAMQALYLERPNGLAVALAAKETFSVPVSIGDRPIATLQWRPCGEWLGALRSIGSSRGGPGGPGGAGGAGGPAGADTVSTDADGNTTTTPGCSAGASGASGPSGSDGTSGSDGSPGRVVFQVTTGGRE